MKSAIVTFCFLGLGVLAADTALALEIRVAPKTLVLSSPGGKLTVHTDVPYHRDAEVVLDVDGEAIEAIAVFADDLGNLVAQCTKEAAKEAIGDFEGKTTTATVTLEVDGETDSEDITVKK